MKKYFCYVGNWGFHPSQKGISVFEYIPETCMLELKETIRPDIAAGQLYLDQEKGILYAVNECGDRRGEYGGGGYLLSFRIQKDGALTLMNEVDSLCPEPSYLCMDKSKQYIMTCHCADPWHVTKIVKKPDGTYGNEILFDDAGIVVFRLGEDGQIGAVQDVMLIPGTNGIGDHSEITIDPVSGHIQLVQVISRLHCIVASPDGEMFVACDKGMDKIYAFKWDGEQKKLIHTDTYEDDRHVFPRYGAFHPNLPVFYSNNEWCDVVEVFDIDEKNGKISNRCKLNALFSNPGLVDGKPVGAQDIQVHPEGKALYVTVCGLNYICVFKLDEEGNPVLAQNIDSGGNLPRGLAFTPDGKYLLSGNMESGDITVFEIYADGTISEMQKKIPAVSPSAIRFYDPDGMSI